MRTRASPGYGTVRAPPVTVAEFLRRTFSGRRLVLASDELAALPDRLAELGISRGAVYDAFIAVTARAGSAALLTLDRRALRTYHRCNAPARLVG
jgi:predicted nucleic acid-binding protein